MKPKQFFYGLAGVTGLVLIATLYLYWSSAASLSAKGKQLGELLADVKLVQDKSDQLRTLDADYQKRVKPKLQALDVLLPRDKDQAKIADQINAIARQTGVSVSGLNFTSASAATGPAAGPAQTVPVSFTTNSSYGEFQAFLQGVENFPRLSDITKLTVSKGSTDNDVTASFSFNVYYKP